MVNRIVITATVGVMLAACGEQSPKSVDTAPAPTTVLSEAQRTAAMQRGFDVVAVTRGAQLYRDSCAACHGVNGQGAPNWQKRGTDGRFPPPPLDAEGHAWHHSSDWLRNNILEGTLARGGGMPAWKDKLGPADVDAIVLWMQTLWPGELYEAWKRADDKARAAAKR